MALVRLFRGPLGKLQPTSGAVVLFIVAAVMHDFLGPWYSPVLHMNEIVVGVDWRSGQHVCNMIVENYHCALVELRPWSRAHHTHTNLLATPFLFKILHIFSKNILLSRIEFMIHVVSAYFSIQFLYPSAFSLVRSAPPSSLCACQSSVLKEPPLSM